MITKRNPFFYFLPYVFVAITFAGFWIGGGFYYLGVAGILVFHPLIETFILKSPIRQDNLKEHSGAYDLSLYFLFPVLLILLLTSWSLYYQQDSHWLGLGILLSSGITIAAFGITGAHELVHRRNKFQEFLGYLILALMNFAHFGICHVKDHHKNVATPNDPATARRGEGLYMYWIRAVPGAWLEAFHIEDERLSKKNYSTLKKIFFNKVLIWNFVGLAVLVTVGTQVSWGLALFWLRQSLIGILLLSIVDYIEHYGLLRQEIKPGVYEPVKPWHSWDSRHVLTNYSLFNLGLHSEHHFKANKKYAELFSSEGSLQMPYGYSVMVKLALIPPLYKSVCNKLLDRAEQARNQDVSV